MQGVIRFLLFACIVALVLTGVYANSLRHAVTELESGRSTLVAERDSIKMKLDEATKDAASAKSTLTEAQAKVTELQKQLDDASKSNKRARR